MWKEWIITAASKRWHSSAAYLYLLRLNGPSLAWEYLRRNVEYRDDWAQRRRIDFSDPAFWALETFEDPDLDARVARPVWRLEPERRARLRAAQALAEPASEQEPFSLWAIPGSKRLVHDGRHLLLNGFAGHEGLHLMLGQDLHDGEPFEFALSPRSSFDEQWQTIRRQRQVLSGHTARAAAAPPRPSRLALMHMRALQTLDGISEDASHRDVARSVFGEQFVAENWHPDSELRAQVRHLIRRARALMAGGYRSLISMSSAEGR